MKAADEPVIRIDSLAIDYWSGGRWVGAVDGVSFAIGRGEILGLAGESGCGKSTVAYALLGERRPGSRLRGGRILFDGRDLLRLGEGELRHLRGARISFVPQNPTASLTPTMTVGGQLGEVLRFHGLAQGRRIEAMALDLLGRVGLPPARAVLRKYPHQLSGGQQQRVVIAMALACRPSLIVLDEPTTGLDVTTQRRILDLLAELRGRYGSAMLYVSHDLGALSQIADRIAVMYAGQLVELAPAAALFGRPRHPYTQGLIASVPRLDRPPAAPAALRGFLKRELLPAGCRLEPRCDFAKARCRSEPQRLEPAGDRQEVACWRWRAIAGADGLQRIGTGP